MTSITPPHLTLAIHTALQAHNSPPDILLSAHPL
jgi:hypothetical protein